ncbi:pentapeptide repeat-containing protein [Streptomyces sp. NPDC057623]|uniref:pentapeptide repeat-containing protein n=1 Tax=Streptomyces sp. NPDC057623 TaxID=3346187 RepID=UPI0036BCDBC9
MTRGIPRAGARSRQLRRIAERRAAQPGRQAGQRPAAPLGARRPGHRRGAPERNTTRAGSGTADAPAEGGGRGQRAVFVAMMLPGVAALATLAFTWVSVSQVSEELTISEQGQIADRYDKAMERLDDGSANIRRGAIFSLQGIMEDSPRQQPAVIYALSEYIRTHATEKPAKNTSKNPSKTEKAPDIQAALSVLGQRDPAHDGDRPIDLRGVQLAGVDLHGADLSRANLAGAVLSQGNLEDTHLSGADLRGASLRGTVLTRADLAGANLGRAVLDDAVLTEANLSHAFLDSARLKSADLAGADLSDARLHKTDLREADLTDVKLDGADLTGAHRPEADLPTASPTPTVLRQLPTEPAQRVPNTGAAQGR